MVYILLLSWVHWHRYVVYFLGILYVSLVWSCLWSSIICIGKLRRLFVMNGGGMFGCCCCMFGGMGLCAVRGVRVELFDIYWA